MNNTRPFLSSRRDFLKHTSRRAAVSALAGTGVPWVHAAGSDLIQVALIGCGGRGSGAASQALSTKTGPIKLVAMADVFEGKSCVVTGGTSGIGFAVSEALLKRGANVSAVGYPQESVDAAARKLGISFRQLRYRLAKLGLD